MSAPTLQQLAAIAARGNVLVAAGAGTGKTSTVTARCLDLVLNEGCRLDQILMVTFTEAAATEMRERIRKALREQLDVAPPDSDASARLAEELALLETAPISTLHSFCLELVRRNFHALELDPQFTVLDEQQTQPLIHRTLNEIFERHYAKVKQPAPTASPERSEKIGRSSEAGYSDDVRDLVRNFGNGNDDSIRKLIIKLHRHTQTLALPQEWIEKQIRAFRDPSTEAWRALFIQAVIEWAGLWREAIEPFAQGCRNVRLCAKALDSLPREPGFAAAAEAVETVVNAHEMKWDKLKKDFRDPIKPFFAEAEYLRELSANDGAALAEDWSWSRGYMLTLLELAKEFAAEFTKAKRDLGGIDFADQEQLALRLLYDEHGNPTSVARACRERFRFVFVDECQDINAAQDAILRAVSRDSHGSLPSGGPGAKPPEGGTPNGNRFLVGDVKQSIYRFRLADPRIFQKYDSRWKQPGADGQCRLLSENFRSREALLNFINPLFRALLRPAIGGLNYEADTELQFGDRPGRVPLSLAANLPAEEISPRVELHVITKESEEVAREDASESDAGPSELLDLQATEREARLVALKLKALKEAGHRIWNRERGGFEPVDYRDMVVLMRGIAGRAEIFAKAFHQTGVPLHAERGGFLNAIEVTDLLNLARLLDNPLQDVPLLAVLRSPLVGLSADELVQLRLADRDGLFWMALTKYQGSGASQETLAAKVKVFLEQFSRWRELIRHSSLTHSLETALAETHYEEILLAGERGAARAANVRRLIELARRFDPYRREGLFRFLQFIMEQEEAEVFHEPAALSVENAVRLMTIHASKGLEFPVVVLAGLGTRFNARDLSGDILLNEDLGLCPKVLPPESRRRYPSIAHWLAAQRERRALLGEEMRLLYVALTRTRDTLILTGTATRKDDLDRWKTPTPITDYALLKSSSHFDWLRLWFAQWTKTGDWSSEREGVNDLLRWKFHDPQSRSFAMQVKATATIDGHSVLPPTGDQTAAIKAVLATKYSNTAATRERAKLSVSELRRRTVEVDEEAMPVFQFQRTAQRRKVAAATRTKLSAAEIGTAHHAFMQFVALGRTASELDLRNEAERMQQSGLLLADELAALDFRALAGFWQSQLGVRVRGQPETTVNREMPFTAKMSAADLRRLKLSLTNPDLADDEFLVVQGAVDLAIIKPDEIWLVDFKTDDVAPEDLTAKVKVYEPQLKLYALALERIYKRKVTECWLHFLTLQKTVRVEVQSETASADSRGN